MNQTDLAENPRIKIKSKLVEDQPDQLGRRKWKLEYQQAEEEDQIQNNLINNDPRKESFLIGRTEKIDTKTKIGRKQQLSKSRREGGFYCQICKQLFKCDIAFLTHLNSGSHNRKLGMSLKVQSINVESVKNKLASLKKQKNDNDISKLLKKKQKNEEKELQRQKVFQKEIAKKQQAESQQNDQQVKMEANVNQSLLQIETEQEKMMRQMGLPTSFKSKRKK